VQYILALKDKSVLVDLIGPVLKRKQLLKLDVVCTLIPAVCDLLASREHDKWTEVSLASLSEMHALFSDLIVSICSMSARAGAQRGGIDLHFEQKLEYCQAARDRLLALRPHLLALQKHHQENVAQGALHLNEQLAVYAPTA